MAIALAQVLTSPVLFSGTKSAAPTLTGAATAGNLIIIPVATPQFDAADMSALTAAGYSSVLITNEAHHIARVGLLYKIAAGGETGATVTVTTTGAANQCFGAAVLGEFSGCDGVAPYVSADSGTNSGSATTSLTVSSSNPLSESNALVVAAFASNTTMAGGTWPPAGWTTMGAALGSEYAFAYRIVATNAQMTAAMTISSGAQYAAFLAVFKAAAGTAYTLSAAVGTFSLAGAQGSSDFAVPAQSTTYGLTGNAVTFIAPVNTPSLIGLDVNTAIATAQADGFTVITVVSVYSITVSKGIIAGQYPAAGSPLNTTNPFILYESIGPSVAQESLLN